MNNRIILGSLGLDLKRVAIGYHRKSIKMGDRFLSEAITRVNEISEPDVKPYLVYHLRAIKQLGNERDIDQRAEDALAYSTIVLNYCLKYC